MVAQTVDLVNLAEVKTSPDAVNSSVNNNQSSSTGEFEKAFDKATETYTPREEVKETVKELPKEVQNKIETEKSTNEKNQNSKSEDIKFEIVKEINNETGEISISIKEITPVDNEIKTAPKREVLDLKDLLKKSEDLAVENKNELENIEVNKDLLDKQIQNQENTKEIDLGILQKQENVLDFVIKDAIAEDKTTVPLETELVISDEAKELNQKLNLLNTISDNVRQLQEKSGKPVQFISQSAQIQEVLNNDTQALSEKDVLVPTEDMKLEIETPLVKVSNDLAEKKSEIVTQKDLSTLKDALAKNDLTQEKTDEMQVEIKEVKVNELSSSSTNNFSNQSEQGKNFLHQNAQEQAVRLELQANTTQKDDLNILNKINVEDPIDGLSFDLSKTTSTQNSTLTSTFGTSKTLNQADILNQINKQIDAKAFTQQGETKVSIVLRPENLGKVEIELVSTKEGLTARMTADNAQIKEILDKNLDGLKENLSSQGVNVNNVNVKVSESQKSDTMFSFDQQQKQSHEQEQNQKTKEGQFVVEEELEDESIEISSQEQIIVEQTAKISGLMGKVDYKI